MRTRYFSGLHLVLPKSLNSLVETLPIFTTVWCVWYPFDKQLAAVITHLWCRNKYIFSVSVFLIFIKRCSSTICRRAFRTLSNIHDVAFCENSYRLKPVDYICKAFHLRCFTWFWINICFDLFIEKVSKCDKVFKNGPNNFFKGCLPQTLLGRFLNTLSQMFHYKLTGFLMVVHLIIDYYDLVYHFHLTRGFPVKLIWVIWIGKQRSNLMEKISLS